MKDYLYNKIKPTIIINNFILQMIIILSTNTLKRIVINVIRLTFIYVLFIPITSNAQYVVRDIQPLSTEVPVVKLRQNSIRTLNNNTHLSKIVLDSLNLSNIRGYNTLNNNTKLLTFAKERVIDIDPKISGDIIQLDRDRAIWQIQIISRGAKSIGLHFSYFDLPEGASMFIKNSRNIKGAYTSLNNNKYKSLAVSPIIGDSIVIEYDFPIGTVPSRDNIPIKVDMLYHDYLGVIPIIKRNLTRNNNVGEPLFDYNNESLTKLLCAPNVVNYPSVSNQAQGVVLLLVAGTELGTGSLINNKRGDGTPYILTASHVINNNFYNQDSINIIKDNCKNTIVFFNYESPIGNHTIRPTEEQSLSGTELVAHNKNTDMALIKITGLVKNNENQYIIPIEYRAYFNGWDITNKPVGPFFSIHQPLGSTKRYSEVADDTLSIEDYTVSLGGFFSPQKEFHGKHWFIKKWAIGTTAAGSSGGPLFQKDGFIIGALTGGESICGEPYRDAFYAIKETWYPSTNDNNPHNFLSTWLDPDNTGAKYCNGLSDRDANNIYRLSNITKNIHINGLNKLDIPNGVDNIGSIYPLKKGDIILGAYICFIGNTIMQDNFPQSSISISPINNLKVSNSIVSQTIKQPQYITYNTKTDKITYRNRWLDKDTCEVYIPITNTKVSKSNNYIVSLNCNSGVRNLNLIGTNSEVQDNPQANNSYIVKNQELEPLQLGERSVWIDLLVKRDTEKTTKNNNICKKTIDIVSFASGRNIWIDTKNSLSYTGISNGSIYIYSIDGSQVYRNIFNEGISTFRIPKNIISGAYVVKLVWCNKSISYKIVI